MVNLTSARNMRQQLLASHLTIFRISLFTACLLLLAVSAFRPQLPARTSPRRLDSRRWATTNEAQRPPHTPFPEPPLPNFCADCGSSNMKICIPEGDERPRACCTDCGAIVYVNPKVVVATVVLAESMSSADDENNNGRGNTHPTPYVLLARRAIEPRKGYWGIPQGFQELGETSRQAAVREVWEETGAVLDTDALQFRAVYNVPGSVQLVYLVLCKNQSDIAIADETTESTHVAFFPTNNLPDLCFPTVQWAIDHCTSTSHTQVTGIQQKTKTYDAATNTWGEHEDEAGVA